MEIMNLMKLHLIMKPKQCTTPGCNRNVVPRTNSTIMPKLCPYHEYQKHYQKFNLNRQNSNKKKPVTFGTGKGKKSKDSPKTKAMKKADEIFSRYIRLKHHEYIIGNDVYCMCIDCGIIKHIKNIDNGHYHGRGNKATRYLEDNCRPECKKCNYHQGSDHTNFGNKLLTELGAERFEEIRQLALSTGEDNIIFYNEMADKYRRKYRELSDKLGVDPWKSN